MTFDGSYLREIDHYFMARGAGESLPLPTQDIAPKMLQFITALKASGLPHRFEAGSMVLSLDSETRENFTKILGDLDAGRTEGRMRTFRVPFLQQKYGLSISRTQGSNWQEELRRSAVQMEISQCNHWVVVQLADKAEYEISSIEVIEPGRFDPAELSFERARHEVTTKERIGKLKPGRNDLCPCGSGKKFKHCHGS
jgi:hypothetical protein